MINGNIVKSRAEQSRCICLFSLPREICKDIEMLRRVYSQDACAPTVCARSHAAKFLEVKEMNEENAIVLSHLGVGGQKGYVYDMNGICPCQPATQYKDAPKILVRQATQDGFIPCEIGGVRLELPNIENTQRTSARERKDKSDTNNGEYP